jgi:hypothetical protein
MRGLLGDRQGRDLEDDSAMPKSPGPNCVNSLSWLLLCVACLLVPVGRAISQEVQVTVEAGAGYDDNVATSESGGGSSFASGNVVLSYVRPTGRTQIHLIGVAGYTPYSDAPSGPQQDIDLNVTLELTHNFSSRLSFDASAYAAYQTEPNFKTNVGPLNMRADHFQTDNTFSVTYHWVLRLATVTSFTLERVKYNDASIGMLEDRTETTFGESLQFSLTSRTSLVGDYRFEMSNYDTAPLNSMTHYILAGFDHNLMEHLKLHLLGGETFRSFDIGMDTADPHFEGSISYDTANYSLGWTSSYGVESPNVPGVLSSTTFRTGLNLTYNLSTRLSSTAGVYYSNTENNMPISSGASLPGSEEGVDFSLGLRYTLNRHFTLHIDYSHSTVNSMGSLPGYSRNSYSGGLSFRY